ncbi:SRPBCC family protein [Alkalihalobacillus pseudalcaliphilus]|uniref:SRPBCC family protein n=1 Tax=Alkalihalobacillus pseudalcaliphilus TaxID=79884 RepID=UPI00069D4ED7|nr:SRPBCC family protein [Alkalihalobacillus pseudalcaliphilus]
MKVVKESAHVQNSLEGAWKVISDSRNWAEAMPGFIAFEQVDELVSLWTIKVEAGMFSREVEFEVTQTECIEPSAMHFSLKAKKEGIVGNATYHGTQVNEEQGELNFQLEMMGKGMMAGMIDSLLEKTLPEQCQILKENLVKQLEASDEVKN